MSIVLDQDGFIVKDPGDSGVRMKPAAPGVVYEHPEDAHSSAPKRGDYRERELLRVHFRRGAYNIFGEFEPAPRTLHLGR
jgi:hypothetical protein